MKFYQKWRYASLYHMAKFRPQNRQGLYLKFYDTKLDFTISYIVRIVYRPLFHRNSFSFKKLTPNYCLVMRFETDRSFYEYV